MNSDEYSKGLLERIGFKLEKLVEPVNRQEADFLGYLDGKTYLIEAKIKTDATEIEAEREEKLSAGDVFVARSTRGRDETIEKVIRSGAHQLRSSAEVHEHDFKILLIVCIGIHPESKMNRAIDTLYGRTEILDIGKSPPVTKSCYFYRHAEFFRRRDELDAALVGGEDGFILCLNPFSRNQEPLAKAKIAELLSASIIDPIDEESKGLAYIPDEGMIEPKSKLARAFHALNPLLRHLEEKYKTSQLVNIDFETPELSIRIQSVKNDAN
jgi:hypothetical protein